VLTTALAIYRAWRPLGPPGEVGDFGCQLLLPLFCKAESCTCSLHVHKGCDTFSGIFSNGLL